MHFVPEKIKRTIEQLNVLRYCPAMELGAFTYVESGYKTSNTPPEKGWKPYPAGQPFGGQDRHFWFRSAFHTPESRPGCRLYFDMRTSGPTTDPRFSMIDMGSVDEGWDASRPQGLVYLNGQMIQGLDINHRQVLLKADSDYDMVLYFYCGMEDADARFLPSLVWLDEAVDRFYYDLKVALDACMCLEEGSEHFCRILVPLESAVNLLDLRQPGSNAFYESMAKAQAHLQKELYQTACGHSTVTVDCIGHTHIDVAWLWTLDQTREKAQRSFSTVLRLMEQYPEYKFMSSQPQLYQYVKESAPEIYAQIQERVREGRWEVEGAMWLEADCNLTSGESLVRQILHGKRFMQQEFGVDSKTLWLPDVFGYSAAMPQILKKSGVDRFFTSKISWNEVNRMPFETFLWQGIDGTEVFTSFATAQDCSNGQQENYVTYNGNTEPKMVLGTWERYSKKEYTDEVAITYGFGDGGGGPTRHMLETQRRTAAGFPGLPKTRLVNSTEYLDSIEKKFHDVCEKTGRTPRWVGELYLEFHRGTYTSMAKNKRSNRKSELLFQKAETLSVLDAALGGPAYPKQALYDGWQTILLNQFHDIIPGSSIREVYEESDRQYAALSKTGSALVDERLSHLTANVPGRGLLVYNPLGFARGGLIPYEGKQLWVNQVPAMGWTVVEPQIPECHVTVEPRAMENDFIRLELDEQGRITSLFDKMALRELALPGQKLNELQAFEDFPRQYDNWEISNYYKQKMWVLDGVTAMEPVDEGARRGIRITRTYLSSILTQTIWLTDHSAQIDFDTEIDWHERHQILKAAFPLDVQTTSAAYEIQFGHLNRPTHSNTSWDAAKFEVCGHKWADLSEEGYGVSLLNDCKYGHSAEGSTLKLTLLKCGTYPNPEADQGYHKFTYSLLPHTGSFKESGTIQAAYCLNQPLMAQPLSGEGGSLPETFSLVSCDRDNVIVETVKQAEDSQDVIIRLYEAHGRRDRATVTFGLPVAAVTLCDLMEQDLPNGNLEIRDRTITVPVRGFEIITLKCRLAP